MTATYNTDNTITEQSQIEKRDKPKGSDFHEWAEYVKYTTHIATLRTIPCSPECRGLWKDGQVLEEGKDYELREVLCPYFDHIDDPVEYSTEAFPLPVKSEPKLEMKDLPEPVGQFIIDQPDIMPLMMPNGAYYHYVDVIKMLVRYKDYSPVKP